MTNSKYIGISFLLYIGSPILYGALASALLDPVFFMIFMTIGMLVALFGWFLFFIGKILPMTNGKDGRDFCFLLFTSFIFLIPALIISYIIIDNNVYDTSHKNPNRLISSSMDVWDNKPGSISNSTANSDQLNEVETKLTSNLPNSNFQNSLKDTKLDKRELINNFDFGFESISNEEIRARFDEIQLHFKLKNELHNQLAKWIDEQAQIRDIFIPYPDIYHKTNDFIELNL